MIPPTGRLQGPGIGIHSRADNNMAATQEVSVTGSLVLNVGTYAAYGRRGTKKSIVACLAQAPVTGAGNVQSVNVIDGPLAHQVTIQCRDSANNISTAVAKVNVVGYLG